MNYLGLDISSNSTGWALLCEDKLVDYGVIKTSGIGASKLIDFYTQLVNILDSNIAYPIDWVGIEDTYIDNAKTVKTLSQYAGVALLVVAMKFKIYEIFRHKDLENLLERKANPRARPQIPLRGIYMPMPTEIFKWLGVSIPKDRDKKKQEALDWVKDNLYVALSKDEDDKADAICIAWSARMAAMKLCQ